MCTLSPHSNQIRRCAAWEAEQRRLERSCFLFRTERRVCNLQVAVPMDRRADQACRDRLDRYADTLRRDEAERKERLCRERASATAVVQKQTQQRSRQLPAPARPARPPPALRPTHFVAQQQVRQINDHSSSNGQQQQQQQQQRIPVPLSKYATLPNVTPSPMPQVALPPLPTAAAGHRPTRERRATHHPSASVPKLAVPRPPPSPLSAREAASLRRYAPAPVSPIGKGRYDKAANKSYFDLD